MAVKYYQNKNNIRCTAEMLWILLQSTSIKHCCYKAIYKVLWFPNAYKN